MAKLSYEDKINIYKERKEGFSISILCKKYKVRESVIKYLIRLIDKHGLDIIKKHKNEKYPKAFKEEAINRVLINNESSLNVAIDLGLPSDGMLRVWVSKYKENGYNIVERKRGRSTMPKKPKPTKEKESLVEENERLKQENEYLKAELEYSKKLRAVVQARKNQQQKKR